VIGIQRRQFKKETRSLKKNLLQKAMQGELSQPEKKQYEELMEYQRKRKLIRNQRIIASLGVLGLALTMLFFKYGNPIRFNRSSAQAQITYYEGPRFSNMSTRVLTEKITAHIQRNSDANTIYNEAIEQYNKNGYINTNYISELEDLKELTPDTSIPDLDELFKNIADKRIQTLNELNKHDKDICYINSMIEEIENLSNTYREATAALFE